MEAVWGAVGAGAAVFACCGLPLLAAVAMAALGRRRREEGQEGAHGCCPPPLRADDKEGRGGKRERAR